jgi:hypothetical protein
MLDNRVSTMSPMVSHYSIPMEVAQRWWKERDFGSELCSCIGMKFRERKIFLSKTTSVEIYTCPVATSRHLYPLWQKL